MANTNWTGIGTPTTNTLDQQQTVFDTNYPLANGSISQYAQSFKLTATGTVTEVHIKFRKVGSPTGTISIGIYEDGGGVPYVFGGVSAQANTFQAEDLTTDYEDKVFIFDNSGGTLQAETVYWVSCTLNGGFTNSSNYTEIAGSNSASGSDYTRGSLISYDMVSLETLMPNDDIYFKVYYNSYFELPYRSSFVEPTINSSAYAETSPANATWARTSGIDTSIPTYSDATISYSDPVEYYSGYDGSTITEDDVKFSAYADAQTPSNSAWSDIT